MRQTVHMRRMNRLWWAVGTLCILVEVLLLVGAYLLTRIADTEDQHMIAIDRSAVHTAAQRGDLKRLRKAIRAGADVNANGSHFTPLMLAALGGHTEAVRMLLAAGADPTAKNEVGETALILAMKAQERGAARVLAAHAAKRPMMQTDVDEAVSMAEWLGWSEVVSALRNRRVTAPSAR